MTRSQRPAGQIAARVHAPAAVRSAVRLIQAVAPGLAVPLAERLFFTPPRRPASRQLRPLLATGQRFALRVEGRRVVGWWWGRGPVVYLVHGWGGRGERLLPLAQPLLDAGYAVVTFDAPGHGVSGRGLSSGLEFARALRAVVAAHGPAHAVIAHSLGGAAVAVAASWGFDAQRFVFLAPPVDPGAWVASFARAFGLRDDVVAGLRQRSARRLRFNWDELDVRAMARGMTRPLLVIHDWEDETVPWQDGAAIADTWPGARLHTTRGLGHRGVLRDPAVMRLVAAFVTGGALDDTARLELELFNRDLRRV